jgi:hypothetical protein
VSKPAAKLSQSPLDAITRDLLPETRAVLSEARSLIMTTIPEATEKVNLGRKSLNFSHPNVGYFCGLRPVDDRVTVEFEFGVLLPDPDGILDSRSCAKQVRYARIPLSRRSSASGLQAAAPGGRFPSPGTLDPDRPRQVRSQAGSSEAAHEEAHAFLVALGGSPRGR